MHPQIKIKNNNPKTNEVAFISIDDNLLSTFSNVVDWWVSTDFNPRGLAPHIISLFILLLSHNHLELKKNRFNFCSS